MSEEKTLGQIAYEAAADYNGDVRSWDEADQGTWEVAAKAVVAAGRPALLPEVTALIRLAQSHMLRTPEADAVSVKLTQYMMNAAG